MTPEPTDKLDAATHVAVNGPADDTLLNERIVRRRITGPARACLSRMHGKRARPVLRGARRRKAPGLRECAQHDQQLGGASPPWRLMAPTTSRWQLRRREAGWEGSRRRSRDPSNTWPVAAVAVGCAYEAWRSGRAGSAWRSPMSIKGPLRRRGGCAVKVAGLTWGDLHGCSRCPVRWLVRGVVRDGGGREAAARCGEVSRGRITGGIDERREGPNAKPRSRTLVLVGWTLIAANLVRGLGGSAEG